MLIVISGKARVGKDTVANILVKILKNEYGLDYKTIAYADDLKKFVGDCFYLTKEHLYGKLKTEPLASLPKKSDGSYWTTRELLQYIGTDVFRNIDNNYWINRLQRFIQLNPGNYIITDGRFPNEVDWVLDSGGIHIRVLGRSREETGRKEHASEISLDAYTFKNKNSYVFSNETDTLEELEHYVKDYLVPLFIKK